jgi:hypothetical protein
MLEQFLFMESGYPPPDALSMPMQQVHFTVSPQYGQTHLQSSIKFPQFMQRGRFSSFINFASAISIVAEASALSFRIIALSQFLRIKRECGFI